MERHTTAKVTISATVRQAMFKDVYQRRNIEACGVLLGSRDEQGNWHIEQVHPLRNVFDSPVYFEFAPEDLLNIELEYPGRVVGVYHSHPTGLARASSTDRQNMERVNKEQHIPWVWFIVSGPFPESVARMDEASIRSTVMVAYHHYAQKGLQQVPIHIADGS